MREQTKSTVEWQQKSKGAREEEKFIRKNNMDKAAIGSKMNFYLFHEN